MYSYERYNHLQCYITSIVLLSHVSIYLFINSLGTKVGHSNRLKSDKRVLSYSTASRNLLAGDFRCIGTGGFVTAQLSVAFRLAIIGNARVVHASSRTRWQQDTTIRREEGAVSRDMLLFANGLRATTTSSMTLTPHRTTTSFLVRSTLR